MHSPSYDGIPRLPGSVLATADPLIARLRVGCTGPTIRTAEMDATEHAAPPSRHLSEAHARARTLSDAIGSAVFYAGVVITLTGLLSLIRPLRWAAIYTRRRGALVAATGLILAFGATELPTPTHSAASRDAIIDQWLSEWQFGEYHERRVRASPQQVFAAIKRVRASDIFLFRTLMYLRGARLDGGTRAGEIPQEEKPILDVALAGGFILLGVQEDRELLVGAIAAAPADVVRAAERGNVPALDPALFRTLGRPGFARVVMNFRVIPESDGWTRVTTETRVHAADRTTQRRFARYWRVIYPGSWTIRWNWLRAIEARLES